MKYQKENSEKEFQHQSIKEAELKQEILRLKSEINLNLLMKIKRKKHIKQIQVKMKLVQKKKKKIILIIEELQITIVEI